MINLLLHFDKLYVNQVETLNCINKITDSIFFLGGEGCVKNFRNHTTTTTYNTLSTKHINSISSETVKNTNLDKNP